MQLHIHVGTLNGNSWVYHMSLDLELQHTHTKPPDIYIYKNSQIIYECIRCISIISL